MSLNRKKIKREKDLLMLKKGFERRKDWACEFGGRGSPQEVSLEAEYKSKAEENILSTR